MWYCTCQSLLYLKVSVNKQHYDKSLESPWGIFSAAGSLRSLCSQSCKCPPWLSTKRARVWMLWRWNALIKNSQYRALGISIFSKFVKSFNFFYVSGKKNHMSSCQCVKEIVPKHTLLKNGYVAGVTLLYLLTIHVKVHASSKTEARGKRITSLKQINKLGHCFFTDRLEVRSKQPNEQ